MTKKCSRCKQHEPLDEFHNNRLSKDGKSSYCKPCNCECAAKNYRRFKGLLQKSKTSELPQRFYKLEAEVIAGAMPVSHLISETESYLGIER